MLFMLDLMQLACERVGVAGSLKWKCRRRSPKCRRKGERRAGEEGIGKSDRHGGR